MGARLLMAYTAKRNNGKYLPIMGYLAALPALGFAYVYISGNRKEGGFGQKAWWNDLRPVHAIPLWTILMERDKQKSRFVEVSIRRCHIRSYKFPHLPLVEWQHTKNVYLNNIM